MAVSKNRDRREKGNISSSDRFQMFIEFVAYRFRCGGTSEVVMRRQQRTNIKNIQFSVGISAKMATVYPLE